MKLPLVLIVIAVVASTFVSYGVHPDLAQYSNGLTVIMLSRRLMWPLVFIALALCIALIGLVIAGKHRAWWLIGLAPVLALFVHRFGPGSYGPTAVVEMPPMVESNSQAAPEAGDYVVGLVFEGRAYAFPYRSLYARPVVSLVDYDKRMLLMWSAFANRAVAVNLTRELRPRDLELVSMPANSLLVYDRRLGQFICGVSGQLVNGGDVIGFASLIPTERVPWADWKSRHPDTVVMSGFGSSSNPARPILPQYRTLVPPMPEPTTPITMLATDPPAAVREDLPIQRPLNVTIGKTRALLFHDRTGELQAFDRHVRDDLFLTFHPGQNRQHRDAVLTDVDTQSSWTLDGRCVDGPLKGERLRYIPLDDHLYWGVMKYWYPQMVLVESR